MAQVCEITGKRTPHPNNLPENERPDAKAAKRALLKRKIAVPELGKGKQKGSVNLKVSEAGVKLVQAAGGLAKYLKEQDDTGLSKKLLKLKRQIHGEPQPAKEESAEETTSSEAKSEATENAETKDAAEGAEAKPAAETKKSE